MKRILYLLSSFLLIQNVMAWGPEGHRIVGQIGEDQLSITAKKEIEKLIPGQSLASVSNWADSIKSKPEWVQTKPWHFVDVPDDQTYETAPHDPHGDIITAITEMVGVLKSPTATLLTKQQALMFIVHFVGDIHQPLHVGRPSDRGGNDIKVIFLGKNMNLHSLWDSGMISTQDMDYLEYARYLQGQDFLNFSFSAIDIPLDLIVDEAMAVRKQIYIFDVVKAGPIVIGQGYPERNLETMNNRLLLGGKRLASLLNEVFAAHQGRRVI
ncbi:MAG: S1/P1 nuclease [Bdellovibrionales bacterium]|nr:S1/P1 nuclease [Bdellovibrionales bacterium]